MNRHEEIRDRFLETVADAGIPAPHEAVCLSRALIFLWYDTKAFVLVDLDELAEDAEPIDGLDLEALREDVLPGFGFPGFAETA